MEAAVVRLLPLLQLQDSLDLLVLMLLEGVGLKVGVSIRGLASWDWGVLVGGMEVGELAGEELVRGGGATECEGRRGEGGMLLSHLLLLLLLQQLLLRHFIGMGGLVGRRSD